MNLADDVHVQRIWQAAGQQAVPQQSDEATGIVRRKPYPAAPHCGCAACTCMAPVRTDQAAGTCKSQAGMAEQ